MEVLIHNVDNTRAMMGPSAFEASRFQDLRFLTAISLAVIVLMALACTAAPAEPKMVAVLGGPVKYFEKGIEYWEDEQYENAILEFNDAIQFDPGYADAYYNRGNSYAKLGEYQTAINDYTKVIQLDPANYSAYLNRGNSYNSLEEYQTAIEAYTAAMQLEPSDFRAYFNRGIAYKHLGLHSLADADFATSCSLDSKYCDD